MSLQHPFFIQNILIITILLGPEKCNLLYRKFVISGLQRKIYKEMLNYGTRKLLFIITIFCYISVLERVYCIEDSITKALIWEYRGPWNFHGWPDKVFLFWGFQNNGGYTCWIWVNPPSPDASWDVTITLNVCHGVKNGKRVFLLMGEGGEKQGRLNRGGGGGGGTAPQKISNTQKVPFFLSKNSLFKVKRAPFLLRKKGIFPQYLSP